MNCGESALSLGKVSKQFGGDVAEHRPVGLLVSWSLSPINSINIVRETSIQSEMREIESTHPHFVNSTEKRRFRVGGHFCAFFTSRKLCDTFEEIRDGTDAGEKESRERVREVQVGGDV